MTDELPIIDVVVAHYLDVRPEGGRVFVDERGAFWKDEELREHQFVGFDYIDDCSSNF